MRKRNKCFSFLAVALVVSMVTSMTPQIAFAQDEETSTTQETQAIQAPTQVESDAAEEPQQKVESDTAEEPQQKVESDAEEEPQQKVEPGATEEAQQTVQPVETGASSKALNSGQEADSMTPASNQPVEKPAQTTGLQSRAAKSSQVEVKAQVTTSVQTATQELITLVGQDGVSIKITGTTAGKGYSYDSLTKRLTLDRFVGKSINAAVAGLLIYFIGDNTIESADIAIANQGDLTLSSDGQGKIVITSKHKMDEDKFEEVLEDLSDELDEKLEDVDQPENLEEMEGTEYQKVINDLVLKYGGSLTGAGISSTGNITIKDGNYEINSEGNLLSAGVIGNGLTIDNANVDINSKVKGTDEFGLALGILAMEKVDVQNGSKVKVNTNAKTKKESIALAMGLATGNLHVSDSSLDVNTTADYGNTDKGIFSIAFGVVADKIQIERGTVNVDTNAKGDRSIAVGVISPNGKPTITDGSLNITTKGKYKKDSIFSQKELADFFGMFAGTGNNSGASDSGAQKVNTASKTVISKSVATGDESHVAMWLVMFLLSLCIGTGIIIIYKKKAAH